MSLSPSDVDRLLDGRVAPEDAPPGYERVASLVGEFAADSGDYDLDRERVMVARMVQAVRSRSFEVDATRAKQAKPVKRFLKVKIAAVATGALLAGTTSLALAGALPEAAQNGVAKVFEKAGLTIPNSNSDGPSNANNPQNSENAGANRENENVREIIENTEPGIERGREVSEEASDGKANVPETVPNSDQTPGNEGANETGTTTSENASGGKSQAGDDHPNGGNQP
jgi:hypothetical protein